MVRQNITNLENKALERDSDELERKRLVRVEHAEVCAKFSRFLRQVRRA